MKTLVSLLAFGLLVLLSIAGCNSKRATRVVTQGHEKQRIQVAGRKREFLLHLPPAFDQSQSRPLVIMLHGYGGQAANSIRETGWSAKADSENFIVAYPEGARPDPARPAHPRRNPQSWNDGSGRFLQAQGQNVNDVAFIKAIIQRLIKSYNVDPRRVYVTGFSNGASMTFRLGNELSSLIAAIAPVAGTCWNDSPRPTRGLSLCYLTGDADPLNPLAGGYPQLAIGREKNRGGRAKPPVQTTIQKWVQALDCPQTPVKDKTLNGVRTVRYGSAQAEPEVVFITIEGLGHIWPGGRNLLPERLVGKPSNKLPATDAIWEFFAVIPLAEPPEE